MIGSRSRRHCPGPCRNFIWFIGSINTLQVTTFFYSETEAPLPTMHIPGIPRFLLVLSLRVPTLVQHGPPLQPKVYLGGIEHISILNGFGRTTMTHFSVSASVMIFIVLVSFYWSSLDYIQLHHSTRPSQISAIQTSAPVQNSFRISQKRNCLTNIFVVRNVWQ